MARVNDYEIECIAALVKARGQHDRGAIPLRHGVDMATGKELSVDALTTLTKRVAHELGIDPAIIF